MNARGFGMVWGDAPAFAQHMERTDATLGAAMKAAGLVRA
jgi:hypothetical protein